MKKPTVKLLSLILCAALVLGGAGGLAYAADAADTAGPKTAATANTGAAPTSSGRNAKEETVYVLAHADGTVDKIIVSDWVKNTRGDELLEDVTGLANIENLKGDESYTLGGENTCVWDAKGNDIYYRGEIEQELPVTVTVSYTLDGQPISAEELAGRSGRVTIRFDYTNNACEMVEINGVQEKVYVPFAMLTGLVLENDRFTNLSVTNGKLANDGARTVVAGLAFPGLQESLGLNRESLELPDHFEIGADVEDFALENTVTLAASDLLGDAAGQAQSSGKLNDLSSLDDRLAELSSAMGQLMDGSSRLYDGLCSLLDRSGELVAGIDQLAAGAAQLKQGADNLGAGAAQLQAGAAALQQGLAELAANNDAINGGAAQVFQSLLATANAQLQAAGLPAPELTAENYAAVLDGVIAAAGESPAAQQLAALKGSLDSYTGFYQGLAGYTAGVAQASAGASELNQGLVALKTGADSLSAGAGQLYDGILRMQGSAPALLDGITQLRNGAMELSNGLSEFNEKGVQKLVEAVNGDLAGLTDRVNALKEVSDRYNTFSGISPEMDGKVKFIWRTEAVEAQD